MRITRASRSSSTRSTPGLAPGPLTESAPTEHRFIHRDEGRSAPIRRTSSWACCEEQTIALADKNITATSQFKAIFFERWQLKTLLAAVPLALFGLNRVAHHMRRLGAPANYQAPL